MKLNVPINGKMNVSHLEKIGLNFTINKLGCVCF